MYTQLRAAGLDYGRAFQGMKRIWQGEGEALAEVALGEPGGRYAVHPALLDAALQAIAAISPPEPGQVFLPVELGRFSVHRAGASSGVACAHLIQPVTSDGVLADVTLCDADGTVIAEIENLYARRTHESALARKNSRPLADALHHVEWQPALLPASQPTLKGRFAVVPIGTEVSVGRLVEHLSRLGASAEEVPLRALEGTEADRVICVWGVPDDADGAIRAAETGLAVIQGLRSKPPSRLLWVTIGAVAAAKGDTVAIGSSSLWGLGRTVMHELPELYAKLLDVESSESLASVLPLEVYADDGESQVAWRGGRRYVARLVRPAKSSGNTTALGALPTRGSVLVTGGLGEIGLEIAKSLARRGVPHLVLTNRRGMATPGAEDAVRELEALGSQVSVSPVDVADRDALATLIQTTCVEWPLRGVVHAAGVLDDGVLSEQTDERFRRVMAPKVRGAWNLHTLTQDADLDLFVMLSSIAGTFGSPGQGGYAAANTFLDALAAHRRARNLRGTSLALGRFVERGLAARGDPLQQKRLSRHGLIGFSIDDAAPLFEDALKRSAPEQVLTHIDLARLEAESGGAPAPFWRALKRTATTASSVALELARLPPGERGPALVQLARNEVARVLSISTPSSVPLERPLGQMGLDSLMALELRNALSRHTGLTLPATLVLKFPTVLAIASHLTLLLEGHEAPSSVAAGALSVTADQTGFEADAVLAEDVRPSWTGSPATEPESVLLTGATGFLGAFLLRDLLEQTRVRVHCLVRAANPAAGMGRVAENLRQYGLWREGFASRIDVVPGDLSAPRLGLDDATFQRLAEVDAIYSNGALLSFVGSYGDLRASHVNGTREILRLASSGRAKAVHHVSSIVVYDSFAYRGRAIPESTRPLESRGHHLGYAQCKWVSEALIWEAAARGIPVTVHRPGFIAGSGSNGAWNTADLVCRLTKAIIELGCMPDDLAIDIDCSPVDYVSRSILHLSRDVRSRGCAFHLQNPRAISFAQYGELLRELGYSLHGIPYRDWVTRIDGHPEGPLYPLLPFLTHRWAPEDLTYVELWQRDHRPRLTCNETLEALRGSGIVCPALDRELLARYLEFLSRSGFIRAPGVPAPAPAQRP